MTAPDRPATTDDLAADGITMTDFKAWVDDGEAHGCVEIDGQGFTVHPTLAYGVIALLMEIERLNGHLAAALGADIPTGPQEAPALRLPIVGEAA